MTKILRAVGWSFFCTMLFMAQPAAAAGYRTENLDIRSRSQTMYVYEPAGIPRPFQVIVISGDLGWVGLSVDVAEHLRDTGYRVIGFNARAYLSSFTGKNIRLDASDIPGDFKTIMNWAAREPTRPASFVMVGVSAGAGLAVLGMGQKNGDLRCRGIIALGLPARTALGWRWTDFPMWITKRDPNETMVETKGYLAALSLPVAMIHSTHDEYDAIDHARALFAILPGPKEFLAIDAVNHRFSDKIPEVLAAVDKFLLWVEKTAQS
jgi:pimeloyl-ACP methyl ester carboxylesterase